MSEVVWVVTALTAVVLTALHGNIQYHIGCSKGQSDFKDEAVKAGKAEYYLDENNERQWRWKV